MCTALTAVALGGSILGTGYNLYSGVQNAKTASKYEKQQASALSALNNMSAQQWANYKEVYQPGIKKLVKKATTAIPNQPAESKASADVTQAASPQYTAAVQGAVGSGASPNSGAVQSSLAKLATNTAISEAAAKATARQNNSDTEFNRRMGVVATGRGLAGDVIAGQSALANQYGSMANTYGNMAANNFQSAIKYLGFGR